MSEPRRVMVAGEHAYIAAVLRNVVFRKIIIQKAKDVSAGILLKETVISAFRFPVPEQSVVSVAVMIKVEIHMETAEAQRLVGIGPFADQRSLRIVPVQHGTYICPYGCCGVLVGVIVFDQRISHINTESVASGVKPETHDVFHRFSGSQSFGRIRCRHPVFSPVEPPVIQRRLGCEEIEHVGASPLLHAGDIRMTCDALECMIGPNITAAVFVRLASA